MEIGTQTELLTLVDRLLEAKRIIAAVNELLPKLPDATQLIETVQHTELHRSIAETPEIFDRLLLRILFTAPEKPTPLTYVTSIAQLLWSTPRELARSNVQKMLRFYVTEDIVHKVPIANEDKHETESFFELTDIGVVFVKNRFRKSHDVKGGASIENKAEFPLLNDDILTVVACFNEHNILPRLLEIRITLLDGHTGSREIKGKYDLRLDSMLKGAIRALTNSGSLELIDVSGQPSRYELTKGGRTSTYGEFTVETINRKNLPLIVLGSIQKINDKDKLATVVSVRSELSARYDPETVPALTKIRGMLDRLRIKRLIIASSRERATGGWQDYILTSKGKRFLHNVLK